MATKTIASLMDKSGNSRDIAPKKMNHDITFSVTGKATGSATASDLSGSNVAIQITSITCTTSELTGKLAESHYQDNTIALSKLKTEAYESTPSSGSSKLITSGAVYSALQEKATDASVVHKANKEEITGYKTFSSGAKVGGTLTTEDIDGTGVIETDGIIRSTGSTIYSQRTSWPLIGARKIDSEGNLVGYAKLEVDNDGMLRLISADANDKDTVIIKYEDGDFKYIGSAKLSTLNVTGNATVVGSITSTKGTIQSGTGDSSDGGRFYSLRSGTNNCGYEWGNGARYFKLIAEGSQLKFCEEANGGTAAPSSRKNIIYSNGSGDNTTYQFNGNASTATKATSAESATSAASASTATNADKVDGYHLSVGSYNSSSDTVSFF